jgi:hypothetical protein
MLEPTYHKINILILPLEIGVSLAHLIMDLSRLQLKYPSASMPRRRVELLFGRTPYCL